MVNCWGLAENVPVSLIEVGVGDVQAPAVTL
jgi:hypothetical protein